MRIAVTGTTGRVGAALARYFSTDHKVIPLPRSVCDLANPESLTSALFKLDCDIFINPGGLTSLEACEDDPALATRVNAEAPGEIARWAAERKIPVFHFSTDYVFSGKSPGLRQEEERAEPLSAYGRSKLAGETEVLSFPGNRVIRVSWVFGPERPSFIDRVFDDALAGLPLSACSDKFSLPVHTGDLCGWMNRLVHHPATGIVHACQSGEPPSWHGLATAVVEEMHASGVIRELPDIQSHLLSEMTSFRAARPRHTAMDTSRLTEILGGAPRPWQTAVREYIRSRRLLLPRK